MKTKQILSAAMLGAALFFSTSSVFAQVKIGTNPTTINAANNLEVEASTAGRKTSIDKTTGQVTIADGTQGLNKVYTSDANGAASWQPQKLVRAQVTYTGDGVATVPTAVTGNWAGSTSGNVSLTFPENGTYAVSWAIIGDYSTPMTNNGAWIGIELGQTSAILNHQQSLTYGSFMFTDGVRYITITNAPITYQVRYINTSLSTFTTRSHSGGNYNEWFGYKVFD
ncbi:hypothetical protein [Dyadobacter sp. CY356]|uniref:hypothetical protein n=1 Tax=Dyadobacter sp. CY356 TaxID=2906442 RepID=UPI001F327C73|nr:hypothetical protein [Dyadobacter sp. CY356]MCF0054853.1 hypothetical protein [Dyadobacter sp. CY356]